MSASVFVQPNPDGTYSTVYNDGFGNFQELFRGTQTMAEQNANVAMEIRGLEPKPTVPAGPAQPTAKTPYEQTVDDIKKLLGISLPDTNQQEFDWRKEQYGKSLEEQKREFDQTQQMTGNQLLSGLAQSLLSGATALKGSPEDWLQYANYTQGGKNIFDTLKGSTPAPMFGSTGVSAPASIDSVLRQLGITMPSSTQSPTQPAAGQPAPTTGGLSREQALTQARQGLASAGGSYWSIAPEPEIINAISKDPNLFMGSPVRDVLLGGGRAQVMSPVTAPITGNYGAPTQATTQGFPSDSSGAGSTMLNNPWQINPMVWDSMSDTAKKMALGAAQSGKTPSGVWTATDFLNQLNASRPKGQAPTRVSNVFQTPSPLY